MEKSVGAISLQEPLSWKVYIDGAANQRGSRVGLVLISLEKITIEKSLRLGFSATNNEAEYETLLVRWLWFKRWVEKLWKSSLTQDWSWAKFKESWKLEISECRNIWTMLNTYSLDLSILIYCKSLKIEIHMPTLLPRWQNPRHKVYLRWFLWKTCVNLLK